MGRFVTRLRPQTPTEMSLHIIALHDDSSMSIGCPIHINMGPTCRYTQGRNISSSFFVNLDPCP